MEYTQLSGELREARANLAGARAALAAREYHLREVRGAGATSADSAMLLRLDQMQRQIASLTMQGVERFEDTIIEATTLGKQWLNKSPVQPRDFDDFKASAEDCQKILSKLPRDFQERIENPENKEADVQEMFKLLFEVIQEVCGLEFTVKDTSVSGYLTNPGAKIDFSLLEHAVAVWAELIGVIEVKPTLQSSIKYQEAVGQVVDRFSKVRDHQPKRVFVFGAVLGQDSMELLKFNLVAKSLLRTGRLSLAFDKNSDGFRSLVGFVTASKAKLEYVKYNPLPVHGFTSTVVLVRTSGLRQTSVTKGTYLGSEVICKHGAQRRLEREKLILQKLNESEEREALISAFNDGQSHVPEILKEQINADSSLALILAPVGQHIKVEDHGVKGCVKAMRDILVVMEICSKHKVLHRDISYGNCLVQVVDNQYYGLLIDFDAGTMGASPVKEELTMTTLFAAAELHELLQNLPNETFQHTLAYDVESWFYTLLYISCSGKLMWRRCVYNADFRVAKLAYMAGLWPEQEEHINKGLKSLMNQLRKLLFNEGKFRIDVTIDSVIKTVEEFVK
ncbi:hypothetical protein HDU76_008146 [Blyttiomyces sp. JEL0837]|nr:hypothetical protein HDU76_008146 [Blyttiomyces sp. JEL0837]